MASIFWKKDSKITKIKEELCLKHKDCGFEERLIIKEYEKVEDKKVQVLKELEPIAKVLNIKLDYIIEEKREYLLCNGQAICCNGTNIHGIRQEFLGYVFLREWRDRCLGAFDKQTRNYIKQYWYDDNFKQPYLKY